MNNYILFLRIVSKDNLNFLEINLYLQHRVFDSTLLRMDFVDNILNWDNIFVSNQVLLFSSNFDNEGNKDSSYFKIKFGGKESLLLEWWWASSPVTQQ